VHNIAEGFADEHLFDIAQCESRNHKEHRGELWQCEECLRFFCYEEGAADDDFAKCDDCWARFHAPLPVASVAWRAQGRDTPALFSCSQQSCLSAPKAERVDNSRCLVYYARLYQ